MGCSCLRKGWQLVQEGDPVSRELGRCTTARLPETATSTRLSLSLSTGLKPQNQGKKYLYSGLFREICSQSHHLPFRRAPVQERGYS